MYNNVLLSLAMSLLPVLAIGFVVFLVIYKIYIKIRSRFNITVNCWFCNHNTKVPYLEANSWVCPSCEQYNGFDKNGDYNREIYEQLDCSGISEKRFNISQPPYMFPPKASTNGFCEMCNESQRLKVEKLAQFEPKNESHFDEELKVYQAQLEEQYRLCSTCDRHLNRVLREKKKMVLGSKFLDFIIKGAETLKQPHLNQIEHAIQQTRKQRIRTCITLLTAVNICCLFSSLPGTLKREHLTNLLGDRMGEPIFLLASHIIALFKVFGSYFEVIRQHEFVMKMTLFSRTIFMMLMYSLGLKVHHLSFTSLFVSAYPFVLLALAFLHNVVDGFHLSRHTSLVVIWSLFAGGFIDAKFFMVQPEVLMLLASLVTFTMTFTARPDPSPKLHDNTANSFHKIYSEDYLSDDETMSLLSQQLNGSCVSMRSVKSNKSFRVPSPPPLKQQQFGINTSPRLTKSPLTSSTFSLNQMPRKQISPNTSFRSYAGEDNQTLRPVFATPMPMPQSRQGLFASDLQLNSRPHRTASVFGSNTSMHNGNVFNNSFVEPREQSRFANQTQEREASFFTAANNSSTFATDQTFVQPATHITSGIFSPFSASTSAVYQQNSAHATPRPARLLSPTRFSTNNNSSQASWLSGGYFNQRQSMAEIPRTTGLLLQTAADPLTPMDEGLSRASSHSSGFESQNGGGRPLSRENSLCPDTPNDYGSQRTTTMANILSFQPIDSPSLGGFSPRPSVLSNPSLHTTSSQMNGGCLWQQSAFSRRPINSTSSVFSSRNTVDSFNLGKINEELPTLKRGDLFQQWKQGQTIS
ncbi:transmembrane protein 201 homolog [Stomoxys calcitrans]|uniref:transmembrane protein 201 homolog n=1 Tax=Stomoxys calcitrans TaxID=35570 RepID=UPI0027E266BA|nr:transmembrane protein 201 homolog [Stomoxys calcitrans]